MSALALPLLFATVLWFVATGFVLWLDRLPSRTWPASFSRCSAVEVVVATKSRRIAEPQVTTLPAS